MPPDILPGFEYSRSANRYRDLSNGRFVSQQSIADLLDTQISGMERRLGALTTAYYEGQLSPAFWAEQMRTELRRAHLQNMALAAGGWHNATAASYGRVGGNLRGEYARLVEFATAIQNKEITLPQALARSNLYVGSARVEFFAEQQANRRSAEAGMMTIEKRTLGNAEHCSGCVDYHERGWQPLGTMPVPGTGTPCLGNCRCSYVTRDVPVEDAGEWIGTRRG